MESSSTRKLYNQTFKVSTEDIEIQQIYDKHDNTKKVVIVNSLNHILHQN